MTMVLDPNQPMSSSAQLEGGTTTFMSPELLMPGMFGLAESVPTPEADIYAFALVMYQVCGQNRGYPPFTHVGQVLTGERPFGNHRMAEIALSVVQGVRPSKPENPLAIGFSDRLWELAQNCWDGDNERRPNVARVVEELGRAAAHWAGVMPPSVQANDVASASSVCFSFNLSTIYPELDCTPMFSGHTAWKRLISPTLPSHERIDLIGFIFSDRDEAEAFNHISGDDAQAFVDVIDEASICILLPLGIGSAESR